MKKIVKIVGLSVALAAVLTGVEYGQTTASGAGIYAGLWNWLAQIQGGPVTYAARADGCVSAGLTPTLCDANLATGTTQVESGTLMGAPLVFQDGMSDPLPNGMAYCGGTNSTGCTGANVVGQAETSIVPANSCWRDPDFGTYACWLTDQNSPKVQATSSYNMGSGGEWDAFNRDGTMVTVQNAGANNFLFYINRARFFAHGCSAANPCFTVSQITGSSSCAGSQNGCSNTQLDTSGNVVFSRYPADPADTMYEFTPFYLNKVVIDAVSDTLTRTTVVNFTSDSPVPCSVLPADYVSTWQGGSGVAADGSVVVASGGGAPWHGGVAATPDTFILPANNNSQWTITGASVSGTGPYTVTLTATNTLVADGNSMVVANVKPPTYNGAWTVASHSASTITFSAASNPGAYISGGKIGLKNAMYQATTGGTTVTEPNWMTYCQTAASTCTDGSVVWTNIGAVNGQGPGFDVLNYRAGYGCSRLNTRLGKMYRGTGNSEPAGQWQTDDATVCYRLGGTQCGTGGLVYLDDRFTIHDVASPMDSRYGTVSATGGGSINDNFAGNTTGGDPTMAAGPNGSSLPGGVRYTDLYGDSVPAAAWSSANSYTNGNYVYYQGAWYECNKSGGCTSTPAYGNADWKYQSTYPYGYQFEWHTNMVRPCMELGPNYGCDGHQSLGYLYYYKGGQLWSHLFGQPNCQDATCGAGYVGGPYPGVSTASKTTCSDYHGSYRNVGAQDLQPFFLATAAVPSAGGAGVTTACTGTNVAACSQYVCAGYTEEVAFQNTATNPGSSVTQWRFGHSFTSGSSAFFSTQNGIGDVAQTGDMEVWTSDGMNTRGDVNTGAALCANPLTAAALPNAGQTVTYGENVMPITNSPGDPIFQVTGGSTCTGPGTTCVQGALPTWSSCASTCTDGNGVQYTNLGPNSCRSDVVIADLTSAHH